MQCIESLFEGLVKSDSEAGGSGSDFQYERRDRDL